MVNCEKCSDYDEDFGCKKKPSEITETVCLLRHIAITLNYLTQEMIEDSDEGEQWKYSA